MSVPARINRRAWMAALALLLTLAGVAVTAAPAVARASAATAAATAARAPHAVLAFLPDRGDGRPGPALDRLATHPQLALGLLSATQGRYIPAQALLDISAAARTSRSAYEPRDPTALELVIDGGGGFILGWKTALERARTALAQIHPGLLASAIPGGAAYVGVEGGEQLEAVVAADRDGDVAAVSIGRADDVGDRVERLLRRHRLVVAALPAAAGGDAALTRLLRDRRPGDVLIVIQTRAPSSSPQLVAAGVAGASGLLTSPTTRLRGLVAAIDVPVTILERLRLAVPSGAKGQSMTAEKPTDVAVLKAIQARLSVLGGRRTPVLFALLFSWATLTLALGLVAERRGIRAGLRIGALAVLWVLPLLLLTGWLAPARTVEVLIVVVGTFALGALTDRLVRWPRGPLLPALVAVVAYGTDLAFGSPLIARSLLGPNPSSGGRFYGLGNELEATLVVLLLVALGAILVRRADLEPGVAPFGGGAGRSRRGATIVAVTGLVAAIFIGAGQLGADVGGVMTVGSGTAVMTVLMLPGTPSRRTIAIATLVPFAGVAGLALLDLATGGNGHFTRTVLKADSATTLLDIVARRYSLAFDTLRTGAMPFITVLAVLSAACAVRYRERIYAPLRGSAAWRAALAGGLTSAVVGALFNDSGPVLLAFGIFVLGCVTAYLRAEPGLAEPASQPAIVTASGPDSSVANGGRSRADPAGARLRPPGNRPHG